MPRLTAIFPISDENLDALPVKSLATAITFYERILGFAVTSISATAASLARDNVRIRIFLDSKHVPARAGSVTIEVDDLDALHLELEHSGGRPGAFGIDAWAGRTHRTFFLREDENGYCYCFYSPTNV
jgi:catechol 2,3-dioxygenase-like lactoylglutathione lyase family enzyme